MRSYRPTTSSVKENTKEKLVFVRDGVLYGLVIEDAKVDKTSINRGIVSTPNIIYYSNNTKCLIDYTNQTNQDIQKQLNEYFSQIPAGTTITLYNGTYLDVNSDIIANLSGTYVFRSYYAGIIEADVNSVTQLSTNINRYDKTRFEQIPYLVATTIVEDYEVKSYIKNKFGINTKNSFNYLGVKVGDYIKITDVSAPVKIVEIKVDSDGNEYLLLDRRVTEMDLTNKKTKIDVYFSVIDSFTDMPDITEEEVGACIEYANGVIISCTNNHTRSQCRFRSSKVKSITSELTLNTFCSTPETDTAVQRPSSDNLIQLTTTLATAISNMSNTSGVAGVVNKNGNTKNSFYGRPF